MNTRTFPFSFSPSYFRQLILRTRTYRIKIYMYTQTHRNILLCKFLTYIIIFRATLRDTFEKFQKINCQVHLKII